MTTTNSYDSWARALEKYNYPFDLRQFNESSKPKQFFDLKRESCDRDCTKDFEDRFRIRGPYDLEVWAEILYWKTYSGFRPNGVRMANKLLKSNASPSELWQCCQEYIERPGMETVCNFRKKLGIQSGLATALTFPAFICPERFPMVDSQVTKWAFRNGAEHSHSTNGGPDLKCVPNLEGRSKKYLDVCDHPFVISWIKWCRHTASKLSGHSGYPWRARDVEMAVFTAARSNKIELYPLP